MELMLLLGFFSALLCVFYVKHKKTYSYWKKKNIKSLPTFPIVGSYTRLITLNCNYGEDMRNVYDKYCNEKYVGGFQGLTPELILRDPEIIKSILSKDFNNFTDRGIRKHVNEDDILGQNLFHLGGDKWRVLRQKITPTFTSSKMKKMFYLLVECGEVLEASIKERLTESNEINVKELNAKFTTDTIGSCAFGLQMNSLKDVDSPFRKMGIKTFETSPLLNFYRFISGAFPLLVKLLKVRFHINQAEIQNFFLDLVKKLIKSRNSVIKRHDFVDLMIELRNKGSIELGNTDDKTLSLLDISDELLTAQLFVFFAAGFETSSSTMSYALRELAFYPDIQQKLQEEIETVLMKYEGILTYEAIQDMKYLDMVIDETLRKYPPLPFLNRVCTAPYKLPDTNIVLDKGVKIVVPIYGLHRDPKYFPEPDKFKPERFLKETKNTYHPFVYMPFGEGPRICIGLRFGKLQTATGLISFMRNYSVEPCSKTPIELKIDPHSFLLSSVGGITLRVKKRN